MQQIEGSVSTQDRPRIISLRGPSISNANNRQINAAEIRVQKDLEEMDKLSDVEFLFPNDNLSSFIVKICPTEGLYRSAKIQFGIEIPQNYPYDPPSVACKSMIFHPNIELSTGGVNIPILKLECWMPVLGIGSIIYALRMIFLDPNPDDPLNTEAAEMMIRQPLQFERNVRFSLSGGSISGNNFPKLL